MENSSTACGTVTLKSPLSRAFSVPDVHPRLRKHLSRCTLDCGFKTSESPALRGFVGERGRFATTSLYLVLLSNRHISGSSPAVGVKGGANSADACPECGDAATAPKAAHSGFRGDKTGTAATGRCPYPWAVLRVAKEPRAGCHGRTFSVLCLPPQVY